MNSSGRSAASWRRRTWKSIAGDVALGVATLWMLGAFVMAVVFIGGWSWPIALGAGAVMLAVTTWALMETGSRRRRLRLLLLGYVTIVLPIGGFAFNLSFSDCGACGDTNNRPFNATGLAILYGLYVPALVAYFVSRRRRQLPTGVEALVDALLGLGMLLCTALAAQLAPVSVFGFFLLPLGAPLIAPYIVTVLFGRELLRRLEMLGQSSGPSLRAHRYWGALAWTVPLAGAVELAHRLLLERTTTETFTQVCFGTFAQLEAPTCNGHYLCTVAAQGNPRLVRPLRVGSRGGKPILVNRQLMIANAFEDLLHERAPRIGRLARRTYDAIGIPICRYIQRPSAAGAVYLAMKPAEWGFYLCLLLADRNDPEERLARMYRAGG